MRYRLFFVDQPHAVDVYLQKNLGIGYPEYHWHPLRDNRYICATLDEEQGLILKIMFNEAELFSVP